MVFIVPCLEHSDQVSWKSIVISGIQLPYKPEHIFITNKYFIIDNPTKIVLYNDLKQKRKEMTDISKYRNVSLPHQVYNNLIKISKVKVDGATLSISKTIEILTNVEMKKLNGKVKGNK
tara:strand:- start:14 stop:370 length:357 start_codon:yes stop_codon:yes gene_type:complete